MEHKELPAPELWDQAPFYHAVSCHSGHDSSHLLQYHGWYAILQQQNELHPSVALMLKYKPLDFHKLALEYPHVAHTDPTRLAYTRSVADGAASRELVTSVGKYLARHWPHVSDHERRDVQALFTPDAMYFVHTTAEMILGVENGPRSCMASVGECLSNFSKQDAEVMRAWMLDPSKPAPVWTHHPYSAYAPEFGWHMALRKRADGQIDGRALCLTHSDQKTFVRTYRRHQTDPNGWSETDFALQTWLTHQGYSLDAGWPVGAKLRIFPAPQSGSRALAAPYLDGCYRGISRADEDNIFRIAHRGHEYWCENASGVVFPVGCDGDDDDDDNYSDCDSCGDRFHDDSLYSVGRNNQDNVCECCRENHYVCVEARSTFGSGHSEYYLHLDNACSVEASDRWIDPNFPPTTVVQLKDGGYAERDDCVLVNGDWYFEDHADIVWLVEEDENGYQYALAKTSYEDDDGGRWASRAHYLQYNPQEEAAHEPQPT